MDKHRDEKIGEAAAIGHMILDGFWPVGAAYGVQVLGLPAMELLGLASLISSVFFLALTLYKKELKQLFNWERLGGCALYTLSILGPYSLIFYAAKYNTAVDISLLTQAEVIFAALIGWLFLHEKIQLTRMLGIFFILVANILVLYNASLSVNPSVFILIFTPVIFVFANSWAKVLQSRGLGYAPLLLFRATVGGSTLIVLSYFLEPFHVPELSAWPFLVGFGFLAFGLPKAFWQIALNKIDLSKCTAIGLNYPAFSFIFAYFWLSEIPTIYQWLALGISFLGIYFLMRSSSKKLAELAVPID